MININITNRCRHRFTLVELIVSMAVFALMGMMVAQLFSASQKLWVSNSQKTQLAAEANMALDCIAQLLGSAVSASGEGVVTDAGGTRRNNFGVNYFRLCDQGASPSGKATSQLYFATRSTNPVLIGDDDSNDSGEPIFFVGVQVARITGSDDPDKGSYALVMKTYTSTSDPSEFQKLFPYNYTEENDTLKGKLDSNIDASFDNVVDSSSGVLRLASNVIDFQVEACSSDKIDSEGDSTKDEMPDAVSLTLVLMDREHFDAYKESSEKELMRKQYARSFHRMVWLNGSERLSPVEVE